MHVWLRKLSIAAVALLALSCGACLPLDDGYDDDGFNNDGFNNSDITPNNTSALPNAGALQQALDDAVADGLPGVIVYAETPDGVFAGASGVSNRATGARMTAQTPFRIASNSKLALGIAAAQLHADGTFDLDAPISRYLSGPVIDRIDNAPQATTRQLLTHTAGVYDYLGDDGFWAAVERDRDRVWTAEEALEYAWDVDALFALGTDYDYSNTGYLLAGLALDAVLGQHHAAHFRSRIFEPLGMTTAWYEHNDTPRGPFSHGYADLEGDAGLEDLHAWDQGYGLADGGLIMSAPDMATLIKAVAAPSGSGSWLTSSARAELLRGVDAGGGELYGLGVSVDGGRYGHGGNIPGYQSEMFSWPDEGVTLVVFANGTEGELDDVFAELVERAEALVR